MKKTYNLVIIVLSIFLIPFMTVGCAKSNEKNEKIPIVIPVGKGPDALFLTPDENFLYIANVGDTLLSVIDTRKNEVVQTIDGTNYPWGFTRLGKSNLVAVSGWDKGIDIIDFAQHKIIRQKQYENYLGGITSTGDGKTIFVIATDKNKAYKVDAKSLEIVDTYNTGNGPDGISISKDDTKIFITNTKDGTISIVNVKTKKSETIKTGGKPELIHYNHDHSLLYISNFLENKVHILDTQTDKIIHEISGLNGPEEAVLSAAEDRLYVVNFNISKVYVYNTKTYNKLDIEYSVGNKPIGLVSGLNDQVIYVTNFGDNSVSVIKIK